MDEMCVFLLSPLHPSLTSLYSTQQQDPARNAHADRRHSGRDGAYAAEARAPVPRPAVVARRDAEATAVEARFVLLPRRQGLAAAL